MAFGKRSEVSSNIWDYNLGVIGESGVGKTTLMANVCEKIVGSDGYILLNVGKEDGVSCLNGVTYENIENYKKWIDVTTDIIKNKKTDYPNLKILVTDTLDQLFEITQPAVIKMYNNENIGNKDFKPAKTINQAYGGFGRGEDKVIEVLLDTIWRLKSVGVAFFYTGHVKSREVPDAITGQTYTTLTTNMMQRYFNAVKTKTDILGVACIDREIIKEKTGKKNIVTKQDETRNKVTSESRKIKFRDDNYSVDSKSRFANIVDEIPLDPDAFIEAIKDAINMAQSSPISTAPTKPTTKPNPAHTEEIPEIPGSEDFEDDKITPTPSADEDVQEDGVDKEALIADIREKFKSADKELKTAVKKVLTEQGNGKLDDGLSAETLLEIQNMF